jgi:uncharacterized membrane protein
MEPNALRIITIFAAFAGMFLAGYIFHKKRRKERFVCPVGFECERVVWSEYSNLFGVPLEVLGFLYYAGIAAAYGVFLAAPGAALPQATFAVLIVTVFAFLFSVYLTFIQAFALKEWCSWCLASAGLCTLIFAAAVLGSGHDFAALLGRNREFLVLLHLFGAALGVGAATITDLLFFNFLKDFRVSEKESEIFRLLSQVIWFALIILILSGAGLFLPDSERLLASPKFLVKMIALAVIVINGAALNIFIAPKMVKICFGGPHAHEAGELHHLRRLSYALGAISLVSWYSVFILGFLKASPLPFLPLLGVYALLLVLGIIGSRMIDRLVGGK